MFRRRADPGSLDTNAKCVLYPLAGAMQGGLLGALIALSDHVLYSGYLIETHKSVEAVLADQRLGGMIMWFSGPLFYGATTLATNGHRRMPREPRLARSRSAAEPLLAPAGPAADRLAKQQHRDDIRHIGGLGASERRLSRSFVRFFQVSGRYTSLPARTRKNGVSLCRFAVFLL